MDPFSGLWTLMVGAVAFVGGCCFAVLAPSGFLDRATALHFTLVGFAGTVFIAGTFLSFRNRPSSWQFLALRRNVVLLIICLAWLFGAAGGFAVFYVIPRSSV